MGAFDPIFSDIDRTRPGQPYVVDSNGWGWFMLIMLAILPFFILSLLISSISEFFKTHLTLCVVGYLLLSFGLGLILYNNKQIRHRMLGIVATVLTMAPIAIVQIAYAIPYVLAKPGFGAAFEFILVLALTAGGSIFVFSISRLLRNGAVHLVMALIFLGISVLFTYLLVGSEPDIFTENYFSTIYF